MNRSPTHLANIIGSMNRGVTSSDRVASERITTALGGGGEGGGMREEAEGRAGDVCVKRWAEVR